MASAWGASWARVAVPAWDAAWLTTWNQTWGMSGATGWGATWGGVFPSQFFGLKAYYQATVHDLCLVAEADAPGSMGGVLTVNKNGTLYAVYLVETTDPNASPCYLRTSSGTKAIREKT